MWRASGAARTPSTSRSSRSWGCWWASRRRTTPTSSARTRATPPPSMPCAPGTRTPSRRWRCGRPSSRACTWRSCAGPPRRRSFERAWYGSTARPRGRRCLTICRGCSAPRPRWKRRRRSLQDRPAPAGAAAASAAEKRPRRPRVKKREKDRRACWHGGLFHAAALRRVSSSPLVMAVRGATVTRPKEPTTVWTISAATYL